MRALRLCVRTRRGLTKVDLLEQRIAARVIQAGNSIGGALSDDGALLAASNYTPAASRSSIQETCGCL